VAPGANVQVSASASDDVGVTRVDFYAGSQLICSDTAAPYTCSLTVPQIGRGANVILRARAWDAAGNVGQSPDVVLVGVVFSGRR
jgi:hypothetical protein